MATKQIPHRTTGSLQVDEESEAVPSQLIDVLQSIPEDPEIKGVSKSSRKRPRADDTETISIARESLLFPYLVDPAERIVGQSDCKFTSKRCDIGRHIRIYFKKWLNELAFFSLPHSQWGRFQSSISLRSRPLSNDILVILRLASAWREDTTADGALWVQTDINFERDEERYLMRLIFTVKWNTAEDSLRSSIQRSLSQPVIDQFLGGAPAVVDFDDTLHPLLPQHFYDAAFVPNSEKTDILSSSIDGMVSRLYPFQRRALQWLLRREGVQWHEGLAGGTSELQALDATSSSLPLSFATAEDVDGNPYFFSSLYHVVCRDILPFQNRTSSVRGGILAEEMGLGKTVEMISLILMHRRLNMPSSVYDPHSGLTIEPTAATLIATPTTLQKQWLSEFAKHAPGLRVMAYEGLKRSRDAEKDIIQQFKAHDVVVVTYTVLQAEIHFAEDPPDRARRHERKYDRPKSPLVQLSWWRVCLDEAQQIESGISAPAKVARLIPRVNAWGITGTPARDSINDLWGLLLFLRYEPFASSIRIWTELLYRKDLFRSLFSSIALRHTKRAVREELELPPQRRYVITMPFTAVEEQHYQSQFQTLARGFGLDTNGTPLGQDWNPEDAHVVDLMKRALAQLRQSVLHPQVGPGRLRSVAQKNKPLRTIEEVLDVMIEQSEASVMTEQRLYLASKLKRGQLLENSPRVKEALAIWQDVEQEAEAIVSECRNQLQEAKEAARHAGVDNGLSLDGSDSAEDPDEDDEGQKAIRTRVGDCRRKLRSALDIHHRAVFFIASAHFQIKSNEEWTVPDSKDFKRLERMEIDGYEHAKRIRKEILLETHDKADGFMKTLQQAASEQSFAEIPEFKSLALQGIESRRTLSNLERLGALLDGQAYLLDEWRESVIQLLVRPLVDEEAEAEVTGDEYADSTTIQSDLMAYTLVLRAAIADRQDALSGLQNDRIRYETQFAERQAKDGEGPSPEKTLALLQQRNEVKPKPEDGSLRGVISDLRELATKLRHDAISGSSRAGTELQIVEKQLQVTQKQINQQNKAVTALEKEMDIFTGAMNARIEYYRQLQAVSDTVADLENEGDEDVDSQLASMLKEEDQLQSHVAAAQSKHRYRRSSVTINRENTHANYHAVVHLKEAGKDSSDSKFCVICQASFTLGVLTICGHQFCKDCMMMWFKAHHNCPVCKRRLTTSMLHDITFRKQELKLHQDQSQSNRDGPEQRSKSRSSGIYTSFNEDKLKSIMGIELNGPSFATKIDTLIRHLIWLRKEDPGAKCIIFSQFRDFLDVLTRAFDRFRIGYTSFDKKDGITRFKEDPGTECFLMDARAHASGLNLVNASHVFLCEPLLNTALELQAIARVDRIGQEHETTVWLYLVEGTIEESIYNLSVRRRLAHMGNNSTSKSGDATPELTDLSIEAANSLELQQATLKKLMNKDKQLGEVVEPADLWECLFGHISAANTGASSSIDDRFSNPAVMSFLAAESAEARRQGQAESST